MNRALLLGGTLIAACGAAARVATPTAVPIDPPGDAAVPTDGGAPPPARPDSSASTVLFRFPLAEYIRAVDADPSVADDLALSLRGSRSDDSIEQTVEVMLTGDRVVYKSTSKGASASSTHLSYIKSSRVHEVLRVCALRAPHCRPPTPTEVTEPWSEFAFELEISHPDYGTFAESQEAALVLTPIIERAFGAASSK